MVRFSNGFYSFSDSYLKNMRKQDLINYIRTIEKNWENQLITNDIQYNNCKRLLAEERNKAIDEFVVKIEFAISESIIWDMLATMNENSSLSDTSDEIIDYVIDNVKEIAEKMKGVRNE